MPSGLWLRGLNTALRGSTLVSKFLLIFLLAKFLPPAEVGLYGLLTASIAYALMGLGLDFYTFATRELIATDRRQWAGLLRDQGVFYLLAYLLLLPLFLLLFSTGALPWSLALWFFPLLVFEHLAQEFNRLLVAMSEPLWASIVLFVRSGLWAIVVSLWMWFSPEVRELNHVLFAWLIGSLAASVLAFTRLRGLGTESLQEKINWGWIKRGVLVALPFAVATLSLRGLYTVDRYLIEAISGLEVLAAYVLYAGIANAVMNFLDASVFSFQYPKLLMASSQNDDARFEQEMRLLWKHTLVATAALSAAALLLAGPVVGWLDRPVYAAHLHLLYWALLGVALMALSMVPHYGLYARHVDRPIVYIHLAALPIFGGAVWLLKPSMTETAVPAAVAAACLFIFLAKTIVYQQSSHKC